MTARDKAVALAREIIAWREWMALEPAQRRAMAEADVPLMPDVEHLDLTLARCVLALVDEAAQRQPVIEAVRWWREHAQVDYCDWLVRADVHISLRPEQAIARAMDDLNGHEEAALTAAMDDARKVL